MPLLNLEGQEVGFNPDRKVLRMVLKEPFRAAGRILEWRDEFGMIGIGLNKSIIRFIRDRKLSLIVRIESEDSNDYWISFDELTNFIRKNKSEYPVGKSTIINVIPYNLCKRYNPAIPV